jgi:Zn-dependent M28 family amino/carboxypeptidase
MPGRVYPAQGNNTLAAFPTTTLTTAVNTSNTAAYGTRYSGQVDLFINASNNFVRGLFMNSGKSFDEVLAALRTGKKQSFDIARTLSVKFTSTYSDVETYNVIGLIPGSDPVLKNEYVVHTAHLDHVGVGRPVNGDSIYNGAHDNASGVASLLEIARIYMKGKAKPKRSVLITLVAAEESGLIGSSYFASNPTVPRDKIVANVNTDMPTVIAPLLSIVPLGALHSTMMKHVQFAANTLGLTIEEDREPNENFFIRSDQYSFVREHIPAVNCKYGAKSNIPGFDLDKFIKEWRAKYYHKPQDQIEGGVFLFSAAKTYVQLNFLISYSVAMDKERPRWNDGELF